MPTESLEASKHIDHQSFTLDWQFAQLKKNTSVLNSRFSDRILTAQGHSTDIRSAISKPICLLAQTNVNRSSNSYLLLTANSTRTLLNHDYFLPPKILTNGSTVCPTKSFGKFSSSGKPTRKFSSSLGQ